MIGIITINDYYNYGNRLQNYALTTLIPKIGLEPARTIHCYVGKSSLLSQMKSNVKPLFESWKKNELERRRNAKMLDFSRRFVDDRGDRITYKDLTPSTRCHRHNSCSRFVIGSDQVWNYAWTSIDGLRLRLGEFVESKRLLSYAASIGLDEIDELHRSIFAEGLKRIPYISVREDRAKELVKEVSGREAAVVLDPTLMLKKDEWREIFEGFVPEGDRYVLTYFLGKPTDVQRHLIERYAAARGLRIRRINDPLDFETFVAGPQDFAELFSKADYVFTDSYHACCFSIIFEKGFKVFNRSEKGWASMNSRMKTLFRLFELEDAMARDDELIDIDYTEVNRLLEHHRAESRAWLEAALGIPGATYDGEGL